MKSEIKENVQGTNSGRKEAGTQINSVDQKVEINIQREKNEETRIQKNERLRNLRDKLKHSNIQIIGVPEGKEEDQEIENLFENVMKENFPNLAKEVRNYFLISRKFKKLRESQKRCTQGSTHQGTYNHISQD